MSAARSGLAIAGVIFDLDGTLVDSLADIRRAMNQVLAEHGWPVHDADAYRYFIGAGAGVLVQRALPEPHRDEWPSVLERFRAVYSADLFGETYVYEGAHELLAELGRRGLPMCILSNKPHAMTVRVVQHFFPEVPFVEVAGAKPDVPRKPSPEAALQQALLMGAAPPRVALLGDSGSDMQTACAAGMMPIGVDWGNRTEDELRASGAQTILSRPLELLRELG